MPLIRAGLLPSALAQFCQARPNVRLRVVEGAYPELLEGLLEGRLDVLLGALRETAPEGVTQHHLFEDDLVIVARSDHPLAAGRGWDPRALADFPWAASPPDTPRRTRWEEMLRASGIEPPVPQIECSSASAVRGLLLQGNWLAMLSPDQFRIERELGLLTALGGPLAASTRPIGITMRAGWKPDSQQALLLDILARCADEHQLLGSPAASAA
jgi:DNA-binding transcriptional LysR family regulator